MRNKLLRKNKSAILTTRELIEKLQHDVSERDMDLPITFQVYVGEGTPEFASYQACHFDTAWKDSRQSTRGSIEHSMYYHDEEGNYDESIVIVLDDTSPGC